MPTSGLTVVAAFGCLLFSSVIVAQDSRPRTSITVYDGCSEPTDVCNCVAGVLNINRHNRTVNGGLVGHNIQWQRYTTYGTLKEIPAGQGCFLGLGGAIGSAGSLNFVTPIDVEVPDFSYNRDTMIEHPGLPETTGSPPEGSPYSDLRRAAIVGVGVPTAVLSPVIAYYIGTLAIQAGTIVLGGATLNPFLVGAGVIGMVAAMGASAPGIANRLDCSKYSDNRPAPNSTLNQINNTVALASDFETTLASTTPGIRVANLTGALVSEAGTRAGNALLDKACDPPDPNYETFSQFAPVASEGDYDALLSTLLQDLDPELASIVIRMYGSLDTINSVGFNNVSSHERYSGAEAAGDADWMAAHQVIAEITDDELFAQVEAFASSLEDLSDYLVNNTADIPIDGHPLAFTKQRYLTDGISDGELAYINDQGFSESDVMSYLDRVDLSSPALTLYADTFSEFLRSYAEVVRGEHSFDLAALDGVMFTGGEYGLDPVQAEPENTIGTTDDNDTAVVDEGDEQEPTGTTELDEQDVALDSTTVSSVSSGSGSSGSSGGGGSSSVALPIILLCAGLIRRFRGHVKL